MGGLKVLLVVLITAVLASPAASRQHCVIDQLSTPHIDETKLALEWYLQVLYPAPSAARGGYQHYSYSIQVSPDGLTVKADGSRRGEDACLPQSVESWERKPGQTGVFSYSDAESAIVYTDYRSLLVEVVCYQPRNGVCTESEVAVYTRMRVGDEDDILRGLKLSPSSCMMDGVQPIRILQDIARVPCVRKINRRCNFDDVPTIPTESAPSDWEGPWYQNRNYPSSYRERTFFGDYLVFNCSVTDLAPGRADYSCPFTYRPPGEDQCIKGDLLTAFEEARPGQMEFVEGSINVNVTIKFVYFDYVNLVAFTCYKLTGNTCENFSVRLFSRRPNVSQEAIQKIEEYVLNPRLCTDPTFYYETPNNDECTDVVYVGNSAKEYLENLRKVRKSVSKSPDDIYMKLVQERLLVMRAKTKRLEAEREALMAEKETLALRIQILQRQLGITTY